MIHLFASDHALVRARERAGWHRSTVYRMLERIFFDGVPPSTRRRKLREFLIQYEAEEPNRFARAYGNHVFLFARGHAADEAVLVTVLPLPFELRDVVCAARRSG